jgi:4-amino-4-deoxy-L-arabinose transferase-like glycosyltransferase
MTGPERQNPSGGRSFWDHLASPRSVVFFILAYCLIHLAIRLSISPTFSLDESEQLLFAQKLDWGYRFRHPPLITWIYASAEALGALNRPVFFLLKYTIMALGYIAFHFAALDVLKDNRLAAAATASWALVFYTAWGHHEDLMHTVLLMSLLCASLWAFVRAIQRGGALNWALFGASVGLGFLSKYVHIILPVALVLAGLTIDLVRARMPVRGLLIAAGVAILVVAPYAVWSFTFGYSLPELAQDVTARGPQPGGIVQILLGLGALLLAFLEFWVPVLGLVFAACFFAVFRPSVRQSRIWTEDTRALTRLMARTMGAALILMAFAVFLAGATYFKPRWMHQIALVLPIWLFLQVQASGGPVAFARGWAAWWITLALVSVTVMVGRVAEWRLEGQTCPIEKCRVYLPIADWAADLKAADLTGGTLVTAEYQLGGNLRYATRTRTVDADFPIHVYPPASPDNPSSQASDGGCVAVWRNAPLMPPKLDAYLRTVLGADPGDGMPDAAFERPLLTTDDRMTVLYVRSLPVTTRCR